MIVSTRESPIWSLKVHYFGVEGLTNPRSIVTANAAVGNPIPPIAISPMDTLTPEHFRLLYIKAGCDEAAIVAKLVITELDSAPPYEELSYTLSSLPQSPIITRPCQSPRISTVLYGIFVNMVENALCGLTPYVSIKE